MLSHDGTLERPLPGADYLYSVREFNETSSSCRHIPFNSKLLAYHNRLYSCKFNFSNVSRHALTMYRPGWPRKYHVTLSISATISQSYSYNSHLHLLLGKHDDERMRLLLIPVNNYSGDRRPAEIKTIPLTWAQAQAELHRLWEEKYGKEDYESSEESDPDLT